MRNINLSNAPKEPKCRLRKVFSFPNQEIIDAKKHINAIINDTFNALKDVYDNQKEEDNKRSHFPKYSRIIFPKYSKDNTRLSEQELRFIFVEKFNQYCSAHNLDWFYSVETPTAYKYKFSNNGHKIEPIKDDDGQSAMIDMAIYNSTFKRIALIEFKALNPDPSCFTKDFVKLKAELHENPELLTYFVMYIKAYAINKENPAYDTIQSLKSKIHACDEYGNVYKDPKTNFYCYVLEPKDGQTTRVENLIDN